MWLWMTVLTLTTQATQPATAAGRVDHARWDALLKQIVRDERVDYLAVRDEHRGELRAYLDAMARVNPRALPRDERLALYVNLYNAWMIELIAERYRPDLSPNDGKGKIWDEPRVRLGGERGTVSLNTLEHELIRKQINDPRAHAALVCAAVSCPPLSRDAYTGHHVNEQLDAAMRRWLNDPRRNVIDRENRRLRLSKIFRWYAADFGGEERLAEYVSRYVEPDVRGYEVSFLQYDWRLNDTSNLGRTD